MANNYTQFSMGITFEKKARKWLEKQLTYKTSEEYEQKVWDNGENDWNIDHRLDDDYLYLSSDQAPDLEGLIEFLQEYLQKFDPQGFISVTWADFCSKLRVDEFGGGAAAITAKEVKYCNVYEFVAQERVKHEVKQKLQEKRGTNDKKKPRAKRNA